MNPPHAPIFMPSPLMSLRPLLHVAVLAVLAVLALPAHANWQAELDFKFRPGDSLHIKVFQGEKDTKVLMDKTVRLNGTGHTTLESGKRVKIGGGNFRTALATIEEGFRNHDILLGLDVHAHITKHNGRSVIVLTGEVERPGHGNWREGLSLMDAIKVAGGFKEGAYKKRVVIFRGGQTNIVDCRDESAAEAFVLEPGDFVQVDLATLRF